MHKVVIDNYIISVSEMNVGTKITDEEYMMICEALKNKPTKEGYCCKLRNDLSWELCELPPNEELLTDE